MLYTSNLTEVMYHKDLAVWESVDCPSWAHSTLQCHFVCGATIAHGECQRAAVRRDSAEVDQRPGQE
jgi:hypothetical protein